MPTTFLKNPVSITGTADVETSGAGAQPPDTLAVQGTTGQATTGTGQTAGAGADVSITAGTGGDAPSGSTNGGGGNVTINPGAPGAGAGTSATYGDVLMATAGGNVGIGTPEPQGVLHLLESSSATPSTLALDNPDPTDSNGQTISFHATTTGVGGTAFTTMSAIESKSTTHDHGTRSSRVSFRTSRAGTFAERLVLHESGNVGVSNNSPGAIVEISRNFSGILNNTAVQLRLSRFNAGGAENQFDMLISGAALVIRPSLQAGNFRFQNFAQVDTLTILDGGLIGIATTAPGSALHVNGGAQVGTPTGGDKGVGSINIAGDLYKNGAQGIFATHDALVKQVEALTKRVSQLEAARSTTKRATQKRATAKKTGKERR